MQIHVARNGQEVGQYSVEEVNRKLADGTLLPNDLAWYEGAANWGPLSAVPGVTIPGAPAASAGPIPPPPSSPAVSAVPAQPAPSYAAVPAAPQSYQGMVVTGWILLGVTFVISLVPVLGCGSWLLVWPVALATLIMGIVTLNRGGKTPGILLIVASILIVPLVLVAPVITTLALGGAVSKEEHKQEAQIMNNLRRLAQAKDRWVAQTKVPEGSYTTVAGLKAYLDGKVITSVVGEIYDPKPVGQRPTATLPATKSLAGHGQGGILTADDAPPSAEDDTASPAKTPEAL
jgi:GYF domain 2